MAKIPQSKEELRRHLQDCIAFLNSSSAAFDAGVLGEAKRLATTIRVLVHDTRSSKSLLGLLGMKAGLGFLDTAIPYDPKNLVGHHGLVGFQVGNGGARYWAPLSDGSPGRPHRFVFFPDWWNKLVIVDSRQAKFVRRDLVLELANTDGGAHVDPNLNEDYAHLTRNNTLGWTTFDGEHRRPMGDIELHSVRQIAHELSASLARKLTGNQSA